MKKRLLIILSLLILVSPSMLFVCNFSTQTSHSTNSLELTALSNDTLSVSTNRREPNSVDYLYGKDYDENIVEQITVTLQCDTNTSDFLSKKNQLKIAVKEVINAKYSAYKTKINSMLDTALMINDMESVASYNKLLDDVTVYEPVWQDNVMTINSLFNSETSFLLFYSATYNNVNKKDVDSKWLYYEVTYTGSLTYYQNFGLYNTLKSSIENIFTEITLPYTTNTYSYLTQTRRYHSNAQSKTHTDDGYLHVWNVSDDDQTIIFTLRIAYRSHWYILALIIGLVFACILSISVFVVVLIKRISHKKSVS